MAGRPSCVSSEIGGYQRTGFATPVRAAWCKATHEKNGKGTSGVLAMCEIVPLHQRDTLAVERTTTRRTSGDGGVLSAFTGKGPSSRLSAVAPRHVPI